MITTLNQLRELLQEFNHLSGNTPILVDNGIFIQKASYVSFQLSVEDTDEDIHTEAIVIG